jgi:hypothetical protein
MSRTATAVVVEDTRRRSPTFGARAPQTLSGSDARWNDERPVCDPAVRTSLGGGRGEAYQRTATDTQPADYLDHPTVGRSLPACARHACVGEEARE